MHPPYITVEKDKQGTELLRLHDSFLDCNRLSSPLAFTNWNSTDQ